MLIMTRRVIPILILSLTDLFISCKEKSEIDRLYGLLDALGYDRYNCLLILHEPSCLGCVSRGVEIINNLNTNKIQLLYVRRHELSEAIFEIKVKHICISEREFYRMSGIKNIKSLIFRNGVIEEINVHNIGFLEELLKGCY